MAITYPLAFPTITGVARCDFRILRDQRVHRSYSNKQTVASLPADRWTCTIVLPPLTPAQAAEWMGWLDSLKGMVGTFTMPIADFDDIQGAAPNNTGRINGVGLTGDTIPTDGWSNNVTDLFKRGDMISFGGQMKRVMQDADSNGTGQATLLLAPPCYAAPADDALIVTQGATGTFRLADGTYNVASNENRIHTISFAAEEAPL